MRADGVYSNRLRRNKPFIFRADVWCGAETGAVMSAELPALSRSSRTTHHDFPHVRMLSAISDQFLSSGRTLIQEMS